MQVLSSLLVVAWHTLAIYLWLVVLLRILSRRQLGQLSVLDLLIVLLLGSAVETSLIHGDTSLKAGIVSAAVLLMADRAITFFYVRSKMFRHFLGGGAVLLVHNGHFVDENLKRYGFTHEDVLEAIREREQKGLESVRYAILETDGSIDVVPIDAEVRKAAPTSP